MVLETKNYGLQNNIRKLVVSLLVPGSIIMFSTTETGHLDCNHRSLWHGQSFDGSFVMIVDCTFT